MNDIPAAVIFSADNELRKLAGQARNIVALEELVARFGSLTQAIADTERRLGEVKAEEQAAHERAVATLVEATHMRNAAAEEVLTARNAAQAEIAQLLSDARANAAETAAALAIEASQLRADTEASLKSVRDETERARDELNRINGEISDKAVTLAALETKITEATAEHTRVHGEHQALLRRIGA